MYKNVFLVEVGRSGPAASGNDYLDSELKRANDLLMEVHNAHQFTAFQDYPGLNSNFHGIFSYFIRWISIGI